MRQDGGFSIVEVLVALLLAAIATAVVFNAASLSHAIFSTQTESSDSQQRLRVAADVLYRELVIAGAGPSHGVGAGPLTTFMAPVLPYRLDSPADPPGTFKADTITIVYATGGAEAATVSSMPARSGTVAVDTPGGCPSTGLLCGFSIGMTVLLYDEAGTFDFFTVSGVTGSSLKLQHRTADSAYVYLPGSAIVEVVNRTYFLDTNTSTNVDRMMRTDGNGGPARPVVDHVVELTFEYYGDPEPPMVQGALQDPTSWTTYGPKPMFAPPGSAAHPPGENCVFVNDGTGTPAPRLPSLGPGYTLVQLAAAELTDGPWCPDSSHPGRFDADLLRIRRVAVSIRIQSAPGSVRGGAGWLFSRAGTARSALRLVPDIQARLQVSPRNTGMRR